MMEAHARSLQEYKPDRDKLKKSVDYNDMAYWYPKIKDLVPTPKTEIIETDVVLGHFLDDKTPDGFDDFKELLCQAIERLGGCPLFLRSGHTSAKHDWKQSCYLQSLSDLVQHICYIINYSACADFCGLPYQTWVLRELLPTTPIFTAFNNMPITQEFRYFVKDGKIVHRQPYWPPEAFTQEYLHSAPLPDDWQQRLDNISDYSKFDNKLTKMTELVGDAIGGYWSVDWLQSGGQWYLIDMAKGDESYKWNPVYDDNGEERNDE